MPSDNEALSGSKTAMIVVDMQNAFLSDEGSMNKGGMDITELGVAALMSPSSSLDMCCALITRTPVSARSDGPDLKRSTHW